MTVRVGRRAEDKDRDKEGFCLKCGEALKKCPCGKWKSCRRCGYPPREVPRSATPLERRRCHCDEARVSQFLQRFTGIKDPAFDKPARRKTDRKRGEQDGDA